MERQILHIDMNNFYASVECALDQSLRGKAVAVCGNEAERHGIVLAKNYAAKAYGVQTGEPVVQAKQKCRDLVVVAPHYEVYLKYSRLAHDIYARYTDRIEPFGMDECWLDVTGTGKSGEAIAHEIREAVKRELGVTVSCGVSFNKVFAKLGSDMKKPDAVTVIPRASFREKIWGLPAGEMIGVGRATQKILTALGVRTIGDLAKTDPKWLEFKLKSRAVQLHAFANGWDSSPVLPSDFEVPAKSIGHGITTLQDLENEAEVWRVLLELAQSIGRKLKLYGKKASGVAIDIRDNKLHHQQWQRVLPMPSQSAMVLAREAYALFRQSYTWRQDIRSVTITAINLVAQDTPVQLDLFVDTRKTEKLAKLDDAVFALRERYGMHAVRNACLLGESKMRRHGIELMRMPSGAYLAP
ncbi:MAG: DNA polymerase IV [Oscillospiraceae bacterium]|jgi:DNA polymerase-4|nr:DNA polymerase IV [Oscillospiraceae bacterium]